MWRTTIITSEVDPETGGGKAGTGGVTVIESIPCPTTCTGGKMRYVSLKGVTGWSPCTRCGWGGGQ